MTLEIHIALLMALVVIAIVMGVVVGRAWMARRHSAETEVQGSVPEASGTESEAGAYRGGSPSPRPQRAALVVNPTKVGSSEVRRMLLRMSRELRWEDPLVIETTKEDPGAEQARSAVEQGATVVIAAGGDGTVRAAAGALIGTDVSLGIVPLGTGNLLARNLDIMLDRPEWALRTALVGRDSLIDTGGIRVEPEGESHTFLVMAGIGFDAQVMGTVNEDLKERVGWLAYAEAGSRNLLGKRVAVTISTDDGEAREAKIRSVVAGNCGRLQGGVWLFPDAVIDDGLLDLLIVSPRNLAEWVGVVTSVIGKRVRRGLHTATLQGESFTIHAREPVDIQVDGDHHGRTDYLELTVQPASLFVRRPTPELKRGMRREAFGLSAA